MQEFLPALLSHPWSRCGHAGSASRRAPLLPDFYTPPRRHRGAHRGRRLRHLRMALVLSAAVQQTSIGVSSIGYNRTLRWENTTASPVTHFIRGRSGACTTACNATAVYRIRAFETTGYTPA